MHSRSSSRALWVLLLAAVAAVALLVMAAPAGAFTDADTEEPDTEESDTEESDTEEPAGDDEEEGSDVRSEGGVVPAEVPPPAEEETAADDVPWTQRFLAPSVLALGVLGLVGSVIYYAVRIKSRYRIRS